MKLTATVFWFDSTLSTAEGTWTQEEVENMTPCNMVSAGILVHETDFFVILAKDFNTSTHHVSYRGVSLIPKCNITKIVRHGWKKKELK